MINDILAITCLLTMVVFLFVLIYYTIIKKHNYFSSATFIAVGILIPLVLYFAKWSNIITQEPSGAFYWIFICLFGLSAFFQVNTKSELLCTQEIVFKNGMMKLIPLANLFWIVCILLNNKIVSGYFFPSLSHIDMHAQNASVILHFVRSTFAVIALDIIAWFKTKKFRYLILALSLIAVPVISTSDRMVPTEAALCGLSFFLFMLLSGYGKKQAKTLQRRKLKPYQIILVVLLVLLVAYAMISVGIYRASHFGKYTISYARTIGYTGPFGEFGAWIYGYFVLSINNLNQSIIAGAENPNFIGLYSFSSLFFGLLQFDNLFGIKGGAAQFSSAFTLHEATVPTGLWNFYYDYSVMCFIPMIVAFVKELWLRQQARKSPKKLIWCALYFYYIPEWFFMGFTNTIFSATGLTAGILIYILLTLFLEKENQI